MLRLPATLTHAQAAQIVRELGSQVLLQSAEVVLGASDLHEFDSSALAVMLACRREALALGKAFSVDSMPPRLRQLAGLYGVAELVPEALPATV